MCGLPGATYALDGPLLPEEIAGKQDDQDADQGHDQGANCPPLDLAKGRAQELVDHPPWISNTRCRPGGFSKSGADPQAGLVPSTLDILVLHLLSIGLLYVAFLQSDYLEFGA